MFKKKAYIAVCCWLLLLLSACKDQFETIRANPDREYKYAKAFEYYKNQEWQRALTLLEDIIPSFRVDVRAEEILFAYANCQYRLANYTFANYYFKQFYNTYPNSTKAEEALYMSAMANAMQSPNFRLTQEDTEKAIEGFQLFANSFPKSVRLKDCNAQIDKLRGKLEEKALDNAKGYLRRKQYRAAVHSFKGILEEFPDTKNEEQVRFLILKSQVSFASESVLEKQEERYEDALKTYEQFKKKYGSGEYARQAERLALISNGNLKKLRNERNQAKGSRN